MYFEHVLHQMAALSKACTQRKSFICWDTVDHTWRLVAPPLVCYNLVSTGCLQKCVYMCSQRGFAFDIDIDIVLMQHLYSVKYTLRCLIFMQTSYFLDIYNKTSTKL